MQIGIDISQVVYQGTGVSRFTEGIISTICMFEHTHTWEFYAFGLRKKIPLNVREMISQRSFSLIEKPFPPQYASWMWNTHHHSFFAKTLAQTSIHHNLDWFITSDWTEPPLSTPKATIIHDLTFRIFPETVDPTILKTHTERLAIVTKESKIIFTDSQATATDVKQFYPFTKGKIIVNYPGIQTKQVSKESIAKIKSNYNLTKPFLLSVGKIEPRKNLQRLIEAFISLNMPHIELILIGPKGWDNLEPLPKNIRLLGYVDDELLPVFYSQALAFTYPSLYEGFGFPPLEAMSYGCPVVMSNTSSLKEIGEGAALLCNPHSTDEIAKALRTIISDSQLRKQLSIAGKEKSSQFTWKNYYNSLITSLETHHGHRN